MTGIAGVGAYAPRYRVPAEAFEEAWGRFDASGVERKAVPDADEDALTMAYEAATRALDAAARDAAETDALAFATTTPPLEETDLTARLGAMLGVSETAARRSFSDSTRAGTRALSTAFDAAERGDVTLAVASDCPTGHPDSAEEHAAGAGAAAFVVADDGPATLRDRAEYATPAPGTRFRRRGSEDVEGLDVTEYDRATFREALAGAVDALEADPDPDAAAVQAPNGALPYRAAGDLGVDNETIHACATVGDLGDTGAASVPLSVARALADGRETVLAAAYGSGAGADALVVDAPAAVPADLALDGDEELSYSAYLRRRGDITGGPPEGGGAYVSVPSWRRTIDQRYRLVAGECPDCGELTIPPEGACNGCHALVEYERTALPGTGTVEGATTIGSGGAPPEFADQAARSGEFSVAVVAFDGPDGERTVSLPAQVVGTGADDASVGDRVEATVRRVYEQEGVPRYGTKVLPITNS